MSNFPTDNENLVADALRRWTKDFSEQHPEMWSDLVAGKNDFTRSLYTSLKRWGTLTQNQINAWYRGREKTTATIDLNRIREMFDAAQSNGHSKPAYRAEGLKITLAPATGRNAGALYVVEIEDDAYQGKIEGTTFKPVREAKTDVLARLQTIAANPLEAAVRYGRRTGKCSCCGRELTNHTSIEAGIGPICASKWNL
jgi:hypothetical protein